MTGGDSTPESRVWRVLTPCKKVRPNADPVLPATSARSIPTAFTVTQNLARITSTQLVDIAHVWTVPRATSARGDQPSPLALPSSILHLANPTVECATTVMNAHSTTGMEKLPISSLPLSGRVPVSYTHLTLPTKA